MGVIVHGIDAPGVAGAVVALMLDAVQDRVPHIQVGRGHVDLGPEGPGPVGKLAGPHPLKQVQVLRHRPVAKGAVGARLRQGAPVLPDLLRAQVAHIGLARRDQVQGILVQLLEIVRGEEQPVLPVEPHPPDVGQDGIHILHLFFAGVGVIEPEVADAVVIGGQAEVEADGLGVADVEVAVGLRRKARDHPAVIFMDF